MYSIKPSFQSIHSSFNLDTDLLFAMISFNELLDYFQSNLTNQDLFKLSRFLSDKLFTIKNGVTNFINMPSFRLKEAHIAVLSEAKV
jgi:hypothetical protein